MISDIITYMHFLNFAIFRKLTVKVFVKGIKVLLDLLRIERVARIMNGILINVPTEDRLGVIWLNVFARTSFAVSTRSDFVIKRTVYFVLFCAIYACQVRGHD